MQALLVLETLKKYHRGAFFAAWTLPYIIKIESFYAWFGSYSDSNQNVTTLYHFVYMFFFVFQFPRESILKSEFQMAKSRNHIHTRGA